VKRIDGLGAEVFTEGGRLYTVSADPGTRVYGERLAVRDGVEYREWSPRRSKLAAYIANGGRSVPIAPGCDVLYLGASSGTTASHISDMVGDGRVHCIEFAPRMFRDLVRTCERRPNMIPLIADATAPDGYRFAVERADVVYADIAQKHQADILADNMGMSGARHGMIAVKARSEDVAAVPAKVFRAAEARLRERGLTIADSVDLEPYEDSHRMIVVRGG
jgi:fibrillarin-like pre-rRNA processing protein